MDRCMNEAKLADFVKSISSMKYHIKIYQKPRLSQKVRLSSCYQHANTKRVHGKGTDCIDLWSVLVTIHIRD